MALKARSLTARKAPVKEFYASDLEFPKYRKGERVVLFDADILAFKVASVCEDKFRFTHKETGEKYLAKSLTEFKEFLNEEKTRASAKIVRLSEKYRGKTKFDWTKADQAKMAKLREEMAQCPEFEDFDREIGRAHV